MEDSNYDENEKTSANLIYDGPIFESDYYENLSEMRVQTQLSEASSIPMNQGANNDIDSLPDYSLIGEGNISSEDPNSYENNPENMLINVGTLSSDEYEKYKENLSTSEGDPIGLTKRCKLTSIKAIELDINQNIMAPELITRPEIQNKQSFMELFSISETFQLIPRCNNKIMIQAMPSQIIQIGDKFQIYKYFFKVCKLNLIHKAIKLEVFDSFNQYKKIGEIKARADDSRTIVLGRSTFPEILQRLKIGWAHAIIIFKDDAVTLELHPSQLLFQGSDYERIIWIFLREDSDAVSIYNQMQIRIGARDLLEFKIFFE